MNEETGWWILAGLLALLAFRAGSVIQDATLPNMTSWAFPQFDDLISKYASAFNVPVTWIRAIILTESSGNPDAVGPTGDYGLMQVTLPTARLFGYTGTGPGLLDPDLNIYYGSQVMADILSRVSTPEEFYSAYNSGNPKAYLSNSTVAANVQRFTTNLATV